jgi:hypothetical protein
LIAQFSQSTTHPKDRKDLGQVPILILNSRFMVDPASVRVEPSCPISTSSTLPTCHQTATHLPRSTWSCAPRPPRLFNPTPASTSQNPHAVASRVASHHQPHWPNPQFHYRPGARFSGKYLINRAVYSERLHILHDYCGLTIVEGDKKARERGKRGVVTRQVDNMELLLCYSGGRPIRAFGRESSETAAH